MNLFQHVGVGCLLAGVLWLGSGCSLVMPAKGSKPAMARVRIAEGDQPGKSKNAVTLAELQALNMSFTDGFVIILAQACEELRDQLPGNKERGYVMQWKLSHSTVLFTLASGQNPAVALLDLMGTATLSRMILEEYWIPQVYGAKGENLLSVHRKQEETIWSIAAKILTDEQQQKLRDLIQKWHDEHPGQRYVSFISISDYVKARGDASTPTQAKIGSILTVLRLNPLANLDPATQAIEETRAFAQRAMYYMQRMPTLIRWQAEMLTHDIVNSEEGRQVLDNIAGFRQTGDAIVQAAQTLPERLAQAQTEVLTNLVAQSQKMEALVVEFRTALTAGEGMALAVNKALTTLDAYTARFDDTGSKTNQAPRAASRPFDVLDYAKAAQDIGAAAKELTESIRSLNELMDSEAWGKRSRDIDALMAQAQLGGERLMDKAVFQAALLLGGSLVGLVLALLAYRIIRLKWLK